MSDEFTSNIQENYDRLAAEYTRHVADELQHKPLDRELLDRFARLVNGRGEVCDMGCGPGHVARYLRDAGVAVYGLDLSPRMLEQARKLSPNITFRQGNMLALDLTDNSLAGITAFYAIVNIPKPKLPAIFREFARVLQPGGHLFLAFHMGDELIQENELWGHKLTMDFLLLPPLEIARYLHDAGLKVDEIIEREPYAPEVEYQSRRAYIFARKPS